MTTPTEPTPPSEPTRAFEPTLPSEPAQPIAPTQPCAPSAPGRSGSGDLPSAANPAGRHGDPPARCTDEPGDAGNHLHAPGDLIAAVPAMLGFMPERSLVVTVLGVDPQSPQVAAVEVVTRMDLDNPGRAATGVLVDEVANVCARHRATAALALIVDDRATPPDRRHRGVRGRKHRDLVAALEHRLDAVEVPLTGAWAVRAIGAELPWWSLSDPGSRGLQPDPATSMVTLRHVLEGRPLRGSRRELTEVLTVDPIMREATTAAIPIAVAACARRSARLALHGDPALELRHEMCRVLRYLELVEAGARLTPGQVADVSVALRDKVLRDMMFALVTGAHADAAEALWLQLARALPDPDRAEAAALLGYCAYVRGDGPLAGVALDAALTADPRHRMANLLEFGLRTGMRPQRLVELAESGREAAAALGFDLGLES